MKIAVIGLGYVGLPLSLQFARSCVSVLGLDADRKKVELLNNGQSYIKHTDVAADCGQIRMHPRSNVAFQPGLAILGAKNDAEDDFTEGLRRCANDDRNCAGSESRFQRWRCGVRRILGRCPRLV